MFGKLFNAAALVALATLLAGGSFGTYLFASGRLNATRMERIAAVLRGELDSVADPNAGAPDTDVQPVAAPRGTSAEEAGTRRRQEELEGLRLERAQADLEAQRKLLDQVLQQVVQNQEKLAADRADFEKQRKLAAKKSAGGVPLAAEEDGFKKELSLVEGLRPGQAKDHIVRMWRRQKADAVRLFSALDERQGKRILEQFQTAEELELLSDLLEQIRFQSLEGNAITSGKTEGVAAP